MQKHTEPLQERFTTEVQPIQNQVDGAAGFDARFNHTLDGAKTGYSEIKVLPYYGTVEWRDFFPQRQAKEFLPKIGIGTLAHIDALRTLYFSVLGRERARTFVVGSSAHITPERLRQLQAMGLRSTTMLGMQFPEYLRTSMEYGMKKGFTFPREELEQLIEDQERTSGGMQAYIRRKVHGVLAGALGLRDTLLAPPRRQPPNPSSQQMNLLGKN